MTYRSLSKCMPVQTHPISVTGLNKRLMLVFYPWIFLLVADTCLDYTRYIKHDVEKWPDSIKYATQVEIYNKTQQN